VVDRDGGARGVQVPVPVPSVVGVKRGSQGRVPSSAGSARSSDSGLSLIFGPDFEAVEALRGLFRL
jgi:hypothetical protein